MRAAGRRGRAAGNRGIDRDQAAALVQAVVVGDPRDRPGRLAFGGRRRVPSRARRRDRRAGRPGQPGRRRRGSGGSNLPAAGADPPRARRRRARVAADGAGAPGSRAAAVAARICRTQPSWRGPAGQDDVEQGNGHGPARRGGRADLGLMRATAHAHAATVNDVVLTAVARALRSYLARQDERLDNLVASVMVAGRAPAGPALLGNVVGVMPVRLPTGGERGEQLARISALTRARKTQDRGASAGLLRPAFGILAVLGLLKWFINHQRMVNVFVTNLRGPDEPQRFAGAVIADLIPITLVTGNVTLSFAVLSYAGSLAVVAIADRDAHRDLDGLVALLQAELDALTGA